MVCLAFLLFFSLTPISWHTIADFNFHFEKAKGCDSEKCQTYFPLLHWIGGFFSFNKPIFLFYLNFLLLFATPMALFFITRKWITVWLYFSTTQYVYLMNGGGAYPQVLSIVFWLGLFATKNNFIRLALFILGVIAHSQGLILLGLTWLLLSAKEGWGKSFFPVCSSIFGRQEVLSQKVSQELITRNGFSLIEIPLKDFLNFFVRGFPLPFFLVALWQSIFKEKDWIPIILSAFFFYSAVISSPSISAGRILVLIGLAFLPALTRFYEGFTHKKWFVALTIISFLVNFVTWISYKLTCL